MIVLFAHRGEDGRGEAYPLLAAALTELGLCDALPPVARQTSGKPWFPSHPDIHFSISHSGPFALCAVSDRPVGVDIEVIKARRNGLPQRVFSPSELESYQLLGGHWPAFYTIWTAKEAAAKLTGRGLRGPIRDITPPPGAHTTHYSGEGWRAAVCGGEGAMELQWR